MKINWDKIKNAFGGDEAKAKQFLEDAKKLKDVETHKFMDYKTSDGTLIKVEPDLAQGAMAVLEDGTAAPDGEYILDGGIKISVKNGLIEEIISEGGEPGQTGAGMPEQMKALMASMEALKKGLAATKAEFATLKAEKFVSKTEFQKFSETVGKIVDLIDFDAPGSKQAKKQIQQPGGELTPKKWQQIRDGLKEE
jgi:vacuolar-type H+-ATPase subunit I/STV1